MPSVVEKGDEYWIENRLNKLTKLHELNSLLVREIRAGQSASPAAHHLHGEAQRLNLTKARPPARKFSAAGTDGRRKNRSESSLVLTYLTFSARRNYSGSTLCRNFKRRNPMGRVASARWCWARPDIWAPCASSAAEGSTLPRRGGEGATRACWTFCCNCSMPRASRWRFGADAGC